jgi:hypothetical protein
MVLILNNILLYTLLKKLFKKIKIFLVNTFKSYRFMRNDFLNRLDSKIASNLNNGRVTKKWMGTLR